MAASLSSSSSVDVESAPQPPLSPPQPRQSVSSQALPHFCPPQHRPWSPWLVPVFTLVNISTFVVTMYINNCPGSSPPISNANDKRHCIFPSLGRFSFQPFYQNPLLGPSPTTLLKMGALEVKLVVNKGQGWRLLSCMWLHAGVIHLVANMTSLLFVGIRLEQEFGFLKIGLLYILSGFGGSLLSSINLRSTISVGASGALFGLLGAMLSELMTNWSIYANKCAALITLVFVIILNLAVGFLPHIDNSAHIGGFIAGFLLGFIILMRPQFGYVSKKYIPPGYSMRSAKRKHKFYQYMLWITAFLVLVIGYAAGLAKLYNLHLPTHI